MKVLFMGGSELGAITLDFLINNNINIVGVVITKTDDTWYSGVDKVAEKYGLKLYVEEDINSNMFLDKIKNQDIDLIISANFEQLLKNDIINIPKIGCINTHGSLLPTYRGRAPLNWCMINGETETGVTVHFIEESIDTGNIIVQERIKIKEEDYIEDILDKVKQVYPKVVLKAINLISNATFKGEEQDISKGSYFGKRTKKDGEIDISKSGREILNLIRAVSKPYPGAYYENKIDKITIWRAKLDYDNLYKYSRYYIGEIIEDEDQLILKLKDCLLIIEEYSKENS